MNDEKRFIEKYCKKCKEPCEKGLHKTSDSIKCADRGISEKIKKGEKRLVF